jgi:hypothetical protein
MKLGVNDITRKNGLKILEWCKAKYGLSKVNGTYPKLVFHKNKYMYTAYYDAYNNEIHVWKLKHRTFIGFCGTIIHEYTHYLQSIKRKYNKLNLYYSYKNHPMEREANKIEQRDKWKCYNEIFGDEK